MRPSESFSRKEDFDVGDESIPVFWQNLYNDDLSGLVFPKRQPGIDHLVTILISNLFSHSIMPLRDPEVGWI